MAALLGKPPSTPREVGGKGFSRVFLQSTRLFSPGAVGSVGWGGIAGVPTRGNAAVGRQLLLPPLPPAQGSGAKVKPTGLRRPPVPASRSRSARSAPRPSERDTGTAGSPGNPVRRYLSFLGTE